MVAMMVSFMVSVLREKVDLCSRDGVRRVFDAVEILV